MITIFTPTYNRVHTISRLYESLKNLGNKNFEWLIVDDGSIDNTKELISQYMESEVDFPIRYVKIPNGGKHRAINRGVNLARGELFFIVDSDDWLPSDSLDIILHYYHKIKEDPSFSGIVGAKSISNNQLNSNYSGFEYIDATCEECIKYNISGEHAHVFKTEILRKYPFPEFEGETFLTEAVIYTAMSRDGLKMRWFNKSVYSFEYQEDGITKNLDKFYIKNPQGYLFYISMIVSSPYHPKWRKYIYKGKCIYLIKHSSIKKEKILKDLSISPRGYYFSQLIYLLHHFFRG